MMWLPIPVDGPSVSSWIRPRDAGVTGMIRSDEAEGKESLRVDVVVDLAGRNSDERILYGEIRMLRLLPRPNVVQTLARDAAGKMGVELSRGISWATKRRLSSSLGALAGSREAGEVPRSWAGAPQRQRRRGGLQS